MCGSRPSSAVLYNGFESECLSPLVCIQNKRIGFGNQKRPRHRDKTGNGLKSKAGCQTRESREGGRAWKWLRAEQETMNSQIRGGGSSKAAFPPLSKSTVWAVRLTHVCCHGPQHTGSHPAQTRSKSHRKQSKPATWVELLVSRILPTTAVMHK